ncbi:MAG: thermosome subunit alpha [Candidatus Nanoarchaeia archaeon]
MDDSSRVRESLRGNLRASVSLSELLASTLGPLGMDKLLVDARGEVVITNDGATILRVMSVEHPAARMLVEASLAQESVVGDGTTSVVVLAGGLLREAEHLLSLNIHPGQVSRGFSLARDKCVGLVKSLVITADTADTSLLSSLVATTIGTKAQAGSREVIDMVVGGVSQLYALTSKVSLGDIGLIKRVGGSISDSCLFEGVVFEGSRVDLRMPCNAVACEEGGLPVLCLNAPIEVVKTEVDAKISITDPSMMQKFVDQEYVYIEKLAQSIVDSGAKVLFCLRSVDELAQSIFTKKGLLVFKNLPSHVVNSIAKVSGGNVLSDLSSVSSADLGYVESVKEEQINDEPLIFVKSLSNLQRPFVTFIIRGGSEHIVDEVERSVMDSIGVLRSILEDKTYLPGGGAVEMELSKHLTNYAKTLPGKLQLVVEGYARGLESIPKALADNGGLDSVDVLAELRSKHAEGLVSYGVNVFGGPSIDMLKEGVLEPSRVATQAILSASDVAIMLLRIDDNIAAKELDELKKQ